jgi:hypothetical protein
LDGHYTIIGRVIDGAINGTLDLMEKVAVNEKHRPVQEIRMTGVSRTSSDMVLLRGDILIDYVWSPGNHPRKSDRR